MKQLRIVTVEPFLRYESNVCHIWIAITIAPMQQTVSIRIHNNPLI